ncbi:MAG: type III pantothenate kinase [Betaproteobacteria bacterium]|nr:MAG: type III pantothenate kinase [Betaproteobacteria bacterium]
MRLCVDVGNTRIKWGVHDGRRWRARGAHLTAEVASLGQPWAAFAVTAAVVANVAGPTLAAALAEALPSDTQWLQTRAKGDGVTVGYARPEQLGADRYAALIAARALGYAPCLVVLAGTAVTIDLLTAEGVFPGGVIVPGRQAMAQALAGVTHALTVADGRVTEWPDNTADALETGRARAIAGAVMAQWWRACAACDAPLTVIVSGGDGAWLTREMKALSIPLRSVDDLVLEGLNKVAL